MNLEALCMICNWARDVWGSIAVGTAGAAAAAGAAAGRYANSDVVNYTGAFANEVADDVASVLFDPPISGRPGVRGGVPFEVFGSLMAGHLPTPRYTDSSGNAYWPGVSPIPADGTVNFNDIPPAVLTVDPESGQPLPYVVNLGSNDLDLSEPGNWTEGASGTRP